MFKRTTAINKLLALKKRKKVIQGGTWAGKTYGIVSVIINYLAENENKTFTVVAETIPAIKKGALKDFKEIMMLTGRWIQERYNATDRSYRFANGSSIEFSSFENVGRAQAAGKRTDLFINEAPYISFDIASALMMRTSENIWIDFNPTIEFWAHTEVATGEDCDFIILKYTDNESLPETIKQELLSKIEKAKTSEYWKNWCRVYIDGEIGSLQGVVFDNWQIVDSIPEGAELIGCGMDFGYSNDPTTLMACYKFNNQIYWDELIYQKGLLNNQIADLIKSKELGRAFIYADSSEPKSIAEIAQHGINIIGADKGKDSIVFGISILQEQPFYITSRSTNCIKELRSYMWDKDKEGKELNKPIDTWNHCIDGMRYLAMHKLSNKQNENKVLSVSFI